MKFEVDAEQVAKEVRERNRLYKALVEIQSIAVASEQDNFDTESSQVFAEISNKCDKALSGII